LTKLKTKERKRKRERKRKNVYVNALSKFEEHEHGVEKNFHFFVFKKIPLSSAASHNGRHYHARWGSPKDSWHNLTLPIPTWPCRHHLLQVY